MRFTDRFGRTVIQQPDGSWQAGGINVGPCDQAAAVQILEAMAPENWKPPAPLVETEWTFEQFLTRFTDAEKSAIFSAPAWQVKAWIARASAADGINPADPLVLQGLQFLESAGLIGKGRGAEITEP